MVHLLFPLSLLVLFNACGASLPSSTDAPKEIVVKDLMQRIARLEDANANWQSKFAALYRILFFKMREYSLSPGKTRSIDVGGTRLKVSVDVKTTDIKRELMNFTEQLNRTIEAFEKRFLHINQRLLSLETSKKPCVISGNVTCDSESRIDALNETINSLKAKLRISSGLNNSDLQQISNCSDLRRRRLGPGVYFLTSLSRPALCSSNYDLVVLNRTKGNLDFDRPWKDYVEGFGDPQTGDYWIGLRHLSKLTKSGYHCMSLRMSSWGRNASTQDARYSGFEVDDETRNYRMTYSDFSGSVNRDSLSVMKGQPFSAKDRDHDAFPVNCATVFKSGNWYRSCFDANIFGKLPVAGGSPENIDTNTACWKGFDSQSNKCRTLRAVTMSLGSAAEGTGRKVVFSSMVTCMNCKSKVQEFVVPTTDIYTITAGGGAGGQGKHHSVDLIFPGGRGALVRGRFALRKGTKLIIVVGCGGIRSLKTGRGGNAALVADRTRQTLLVMAGGGGGAALWSAGLNARASEKSKLPLYLCNKMTTFSNIMRRQFNSERSPGLGWLDIKEKVLRTASNNDTLTTEGLSGDWEGGGGGGYTGGMMGPDNQSSAGGGGGSFCNKVASDGICEKEEGGNMIDVGYVMIERNVCF